MDTVHSFMMKTIGGDVKPLADYKGRVLLIVNTASFCGFTPQYKSLETLYRRYKDKGLSVLAFPSNDFGAQEPGTDAQIKHFCESRYAVSFDLFSKIAVKGNDIHPFYRFLTYESGHDGPVAWNFAKFLADKSGRVAARFPSDVDPLSPALTAKVEELLAQ